MENLGVPASCLKARQGGLAQKICDLTAELSELLVERALGPVPHQPCRTGT